MNFEELMQKTFVLARQGIPFAKPNPLVGALLIKNGEVIASGAHLRYGSEHAEIHCLKTAKERSRGSTLICNLEPCSHRDKQTPPCVDALIEAGIKEVVIATEDPNPKVKGDGIKRLQAAGIKVQVGILEKEAKRLNEAYFHFQTTSRPFVWAKWAQTLDGKLALPDGNSKWISSEISRKRAHELRLQNEAILVGMSTVLNDDPELTIRNIEAPREYCPLRVIVGNANRLIEKKINWKVLSDEFKQHTLVCSYGHNDMVEKKLIDLGVQFIDLGVEKTHVAHAVIEKLATRRITSLLIEGGPYTLRSFFEQKRINKVSIFVANKFFGQGLSIFDQAPVKSVNESLQLLDPIYTQLGEDCYIEAYPNYKHISF